MKIEDNHYTYRIETKDPNGGSLDFIDIDTVEPLRCAYDVQDELNLETNEHIKRVEEIVLDANSTEFWYVDEARTSDTHLVCYFEEIKLMASKDHPMVDTNRSVFEYGKINSNEHQNTNFICTHVMDNGVSRLYMSIDKTIFEFATFNNETIKQYISMHPVMVWYALRYEIIIPRSMSKGHLLTLGGQTDITLTTTSEQAKLPIMKFNVGDTQYTLDTNPIHINSTQEGTQIRNIVLEGNTPINYARGNGVNTTEATSDTRYDFEPFYDGQATIQGTVEGGYVSAKLYGDTMVNIAKPYGETPLLTATNESALCDDLLGMNEEGIVLADGEITEGRIYGDSAKGENPVFVDGRLDENSGGTEDVVGVCCHSERAEVPKGTFTFTTGYTWNKVAYYTDSGSFIKCDVTNNPSVTSTPPSNASYVIYGSDNTLQPTEGFTWKYEDGADVYERIESVVNPCTIFLNNNFTDKNLFNKDTVTVGYALNTSTGEPSRVDSSYSTSDFIFVAEEYNYRVANDNCSEMCFYDLNKNFISSISRSFTPTQNGYIRFVYGNSNINRVMFGSFSSTNPTYTEYQQLDMQQATFPYTLNKLPNGVADYIDVVNKVHVQRVGYVEDASVLNWNEYTNLDNSYTCFFIHDKLSQVAKNNTTFLCIGVENRNSTIIDKSLYSAQGMSLLTFAKDTTPLVSYDVEGFKAKLAELGVKFLYELATPIYTPLTDEEVTQLPLSAYKDGYINLSSDQLMPSFEFRMKASNRYQVDMLETGYYYLNAPVGNVKLGTANVDVQQMPCIVKVDNVGNYRLVANVVDIYYKEVPLNYEEGYLDISNGTVIQSNDDRWTSDFVEIPYYDKSIYIMNDTKLVDVCYYDENKDFINGVALGNTKIGQEVYLTNTEVKYMRLSGKNDERILGLRSQVITLAKLPSHRIPTSFTQGMKCGTDFGYWEGIKESKFDRLWTTNYDWSLCDDTKLSSPIQLNRIEYNNTIVEDEFDIATGKLTRRIGKVVFTKELLDEIMSTPDTYGSDGNGSHYVYIYEIGVPIKKKTASIIVSNIARGNGTAYVNANAPIVASTYGNMWLFKLKDYASLVTKENKMDYLKRYCEKNPIEIYFELEVPEISYLMPTKNIVKTSTNSQSMQTTVNNGYLNPQIKPSHLTYPVPSLVGNRTYTVVHNRKNIANSTKPIELNLGGTVVQLNDASSKTLVKTPSTLAHSNLIFTGGESTVDHIMVLDGDWTNKPIEYFENMMGHDTDAIITIIGAGKIDEVEEQYLW